MDCNEQDIKLNYIFLFYNVIFICFLPEHLIILLNLNEVVKISALGPELHENSTLWSEGTILVNCKNCKNTNLKTHLFQYFFSYIKCTLVSDGSDMDT